MGHLKVNVTISSATGIGGVYPFVVVCFDGDVSNEVHKTEAAVGGETCTWNSVFELDLTTQIKNLVAAGKPEPTYLTFFLFDTGQTGIPSLGSAGVLLSTVREHQIAQGDFPVVNGTGTVSITVTSNKYKGDEPQHWYQSNAAKIAAGTGMAALAAGVAGLAVNHVRKKKKKKEGERDEDEEQALQPGTRGLPQGEEGAPEGGNRTWWDSDSDSDDKEEGAPGEVQYQRYEQPPHDDDDEEEGDQ